MAKKYSGKTRRFGTVAVLLTVLTVVTVILLNGIVTKLPLRLVYPHDPAADLPRDRRVL